MVPEEGLSLPGVPFPAPRCYTPSVLDCAMIVAGASSRMRPPPGGIGCPAGGFKPLLPFGDSTLVESSARSALDAGCRLILVVGYRGDEVAALFDAPSYLPERRSGRIVVARNADWKLGLATSIQAALPRVESEAFFVALADMPFLRPEHYEALAAARSASAASVASASEGPSQAAGAGERIFAASCRGRRGHPVLFPSALIPAIEALPPGGGLRGFVGGQPTVLVEIGEAALRDVDTPEDYAEARRPPRPAGV